MEAFILNCEGAYFVEITVDGNLVDVAGPFDDAADAEWMAERTIRIGS